MNKKTLILAACSVSIMLFSCDKDDDIDPYTVPVSYTLFNNVEFGEATAAVNMWSGFQFYLGRGATRQLSQDTVNFLWNNTNNAWTTEFIPNLPNTPSQLSASIIKLSSITADAAIFKVFADSMVKISQFYNTPGSEGKAGKLGSRIFNYAGFEFNQAVSKGLMGAMQLTKIIQHLDAAAGADNNTIVLGQGTAMEHQWDLAFGYVGIPAHYDSSKAYTSADQTRPLGIGGYFAERGKFIKAGGTIYEAFRKGRAAIAAKDYKARDAASATIKEFVEKTIAAGMYYYVTSPQGTTVKSDQLHALSEAKSFLIALKYRPASAKLTAANYTTLAGFLSFDQSNYDLINDASFTKLKQAQQILTTTYGQLQP
jgi:hypothetical protein